MVDKQRSHFRRLLRQKEKELLSVLQQRDGIAIAEREADTMDEVLSANERDLAISALHREATVLREVRAALHSLDNDTYGICVSCDTSIPARRLEAVPWAGLCIHCQEEVDRETQQDAAANGPATLRRVA